MNIRIHLETISDRWFVTAIAGSRNLRRLLAAMYLSVALLGVYLSSPVFAEDNEFKLRAHSSMDDGKFERAIGYLERVPEEQRSSLDNRNLAYSYFRERKLDRAQLAAERAIRQSPEDDQAMLLLGDIFAQQGEWDKALPLYIKACESRNAPPERWLRVGQAWQALGEPEKAEAAFSEHERLSEMR